MGKAAVRIVLFGAPMLIAACTGNGGKQGASSDVQPDPTPVSVAAAIQKEFPGAITYRKAVDSILQHIAALGINPDQILWGQSTCVDDITNTKNKLAFSKVKGPFSFGGLAGLPFTGITGLNAFAHHVPEDGAALLFVGPHLGCNADGWGYILRHGQNHSSSCCGAITAALTKLKAGELTLQEPAGDDYQQGVIEQLALAHKDQILASSEPIVELTKLVKKEAELKMTEYAHSVHERHFAYAVVVFGVIINTDYEFEDYLWIDKIAIKDIRKDQWITVP